MNKEYNPQAIEARWRAHWDAEGHGRADLARAARPFNNLMEFPYPSGEGLHVGHVFSFGGADTYGRFMRRRGYDVFQPIGFDAFGINSENYALKIGAHPAILTPRAIARFHEQLRRLGAAFDWSRAVDTSDPAYYRWTQWVFVQLFKAGLAYRAEAPVNWCPSCKTVLANEQVVAGHCERCDTQMTQRRMTQWFFRITRYADRLLDFGAVDFSAAVIKRQREWIGRSEGVEIDFQVATRESQVAEDCGPAACDLGPMTVFTTRPDTIFEVTFMALAPEHPLAEQVAQGDGSQAAAVRDYIARARGRLELERQQGEPEGVFTGLYAVNPANGAHVPIWVADYVLIGYGTGAIMGVPAHDERDQRFAQRYGLPIEPESMVRILWSVAADNVQSTTDNGKPTTDQSAICNLQSAIAWLEDRGIGRPMVRYRLHDWLISRQRYWGPPIPIVYCERCGTLPVPEEQLPVLLPPLEQFRPTGTGVAPLATVESFVKTTCPQCGGPAQRETDVSDTFLDSAWYFLRYTSTERDDAPWDAARVQHWLPVSMYTGGPEHATMHHLYARFVSMALHDLGLSPITEPFARLRLHGTITHGGRKMSKSRGNVVNPDEYIARYGADATRMALLFLGPFDEDADFSDRGVVGMARFLGRVWELCHDKPQATSRKSQVASTNSSATCDLRPATVNRVTEGLENQRFHTAIAALMEYANWLRAERGRLPPGEFDAARRTLVLLLAPFAPHIGEELWERLGGAGSIHNQPWPQTTPEAAEAMIELPVQVDGRLRDRVALPAGASEEQARAAALAQPHVLAAIGARAVRRVVVVPGRVVNVVTGD
jgi:leucyl-tRNA synthetase